MAENIEQAPDHVTALKQISKNIQTTMSSHLGEFRKAADSSNKNVLKVIKDLGTSILSQKKQLAGLSESIEEVAESSNKIASKMDQMNSHLLETLNVQQEMLAQMKNVFGGIQSMNTNWQQLSNTNNNNTIFGGIWDAMKGIANMAKGPAAMAAMGVGAYGLSQMGGDANKSIKTSGTFSQNQQEAFAAARAEGLSESAAKIAVANVSGENLKNPGQVYADPSRRNPNQKAHGIVAWDDERSARIKQVFGKYPQEMSVADQTKAYIWEMRTHYKKAYADLVNENMNEQERLSSVVANFEKPRDVGGAVSNRMGFLRGLKVTDKPTKPEAQDKGKVTGDVKVAPEPKTDAAPTAAPPPATPNIPPAEPTKTERHPEGHGGIISGAAKQEYGGEGKVDRSALAGKDLSGVNKDLVSKLQEAASEFKAKTGQPVSVTSGYRSQEKQAQLYQAYITGKSSIPANPPGKSNHETGNAVDISTAQARQMDQMGILARHGLARPLGERDPVHIQLAGTGTSQGSFGKAGGDATPVGDKETATPGAMPSDSGGGSEGAPAADKPSQSELAGVDLMKLTMGAYSSGAGGQGGMAGIMGGLGGIGGIASMMPGIMSAKMNEAAGIPGAQPVMAPERPIPVESPGVSAAANSIEQNALQSQIEDYNQKQKAAEVSEKTDQLRERISNMQQGQGDYQPGVDYNGPHDQEVISKWAERLGFGGSHYSEFNKIKLF
jgi:hypothetical protein